MDRIVEESQLGKGAIYLYFKSKDEINAVSMARIFDRSLHEAAEQIKPNRPVIQCIMRVAQCTIEQIPMRPSSRVCLPETPKAAKSLGSYDSTP